MQNESLISTYKVNKHRYGCQAVMQLTNQLINTNHKHAYQIINIKKQVVNEIQRHNVDMMKDSKKHTKKRLQNVKKRGTKVENNGSIMD